MYMVTLVVEGRRRLLGDVAGDPSKPNGTEGAARLLPSPLGNAVVEEWKAIPSYRPEVANVSLQLMPDHLHLIMFVREMLPMHLGNVIAAFEARCNRRYLDLVAKGAAPQIQQYVQDEQTVAKRESRKSKYGLLFEPGFNDKILRHEGELQAWIDYLADNPRRLLVKRLTPDLFRVKHNITAGGYTFQAMGNEMLLEFPRRVFVQCSRSLGETDVSSLLTRADLDIGEGNVFVSPSVSPGEKAVMRRAFERGCPTVVLRENGFGQYEKPHGRAFEACAEGRMLLLSPWEHHTDRRLITRSQCLTLNAMAEALSTARL